MKITAEFDTKTKTANIRMGGQKVENVSGLELFVFDLESGEGMITIRTIDNSKKEDGVFITTTINAAKHKLPQFIKDMQDKKKDKKDNKDGKDSKDDKNKKTSKDKDKKDTKSKLSEALFPSKTV